MLFIPARSRCYVLGGVQPVSVNHKVPVSQINFRRFRFVFAIEELREGTLLNRVDGIVVEPGRVTWNDDMMSLFGDIVLGLVLVVTSIFTSVSVVSICSTLWVSASCWFINIKNCLNL